MPRIVDFTIVQSSKLKVLVDDGTEFNIQIIPVRITRLEQLLPNGEPMYEFNFQQLVDQIPPEGKLVPAALKKDV